MIAQVRQQAEFFEKLAAIGGMFRLQRAINWFLVAAATGLGVDSLMLLVARFKAFTPAPWLLAAIPLGLAVLAAALCAARGLPQAVVAGRADRELALKERLTTALELQRAHATGSLAEAQIQDAMWYVRRIEVWRAFPPRLPTRELNIFLGVLAITAALLFIPNPAKQAIERQAAAAEAIKQVAQEVDKTAQDIQKNEAATGNHSQDEQNIDNILNELRRDLRQPSLTADQALAKLQAAQQKLQSNQDSSAETLADALQALSTSFDSQPLLQKAAQDIRNNNYTAAAQDLRQAGQQASSLDQQQRDSLAASLRAAAAAQAKAGNTRLSDSLGRAADALSSGSQDANQAFSQAAGDIQNTGQRAQTQQNLSSALNQVQQGESALSQQAGDQGLTGDSSGTAMDNPNGSDAGQNGMNTGAQGGSGNQTGQGQSQGQGDGQGQGQGQGQGGTGGGHGSGGQGGETVYVGADTHFEGVPGQQGANGQITSQDDNSLSNPANNGSSVPYQQVVGQYQKQASQAMDRGAVPLSYRQIVKDYFSSLAPRN